MSVLILAHSVSATSFNLLHKRVSQPNKTIFTKSRESPSVSFIQSVCDAMLAVSGDAPAGTLVYNIRILTLLCPLKGHNVLVSGWCGHVRSAELSRDAAFISVPTLLPLHLVSRTYMVKQI